MKVHYFLRAFGALCLMCGVAPLASAQQPTVADYENLQRIVAEQDARLRQLETSRLPATESPSGYFSVNASNSLERRMTELEEFIYDLEDKGEGKPDGGSSIASGHSDSKMKIVGRVHADYWGFPGDSAGVNEIENENVLFSPQDRVGFRRMRFGVRGSLPSNMEYRIEMEFAGGNRSEFRDAWLGWNELPVVQTLLIGNQKRPYGLDHLNSSRYNVFLERPFVIESFNQDARRLGICAYGVSNDQRWNWRYGVYNQRLIQDEGNFISDHLQGEVAGRLANTIWYDESSGGRGYAHWAVSGTWADSDGTGESPPRASSEARFRTRPEARTQARWLDTGIIANANDYFMVGLESVVNVGPVQVVGEYQNLFMDRSVGSDVHLHGGYVYMSYFLTGEHMPWSRKSGTLGRIKPFENFFLVERCRGGKGWGKGAWQVAARYSYADFNDDVLGPNPVFGGVGQAVTLGVNWYWTPYARIQFNYITGKIHDRDSNNDENPPGPQNLVSGEYSIVGARAMVDF